MYLIYLQRDTCIYIYIYIHVYRVHVPVTSCVSFQVESMTPRLQETCLALLGKNDEKLAQLSCEEMEAEVNDMIVRVQALIQPIRIKGTEASMEPPGFAFAEVCGFHIYNFFFPMRPG